jgi:signal transduction histidine kinase
MGQTKTPTIMRIRTKLIASFLSIILLFSIIGQISFRAHGRTGQQFNEMFEHAWQEITAIQRIQSEVFKMQTEILSAANHLMEENGKASKELEAEEAEFFEARESVEMWLLKLEETLPGNDPLVVEVRKNADSYLSIGKEMFGLVGGKYSEEKAAEVLEKLEDVEDEFVQISKTALETKQHEYQQHGENIQASIVRSRYNVLLAWGLIVVAALLFSWFFSAHIFKPLESLSQAFQKLANGDFGIKSNIRRKDEIGELAVDFDNMVKELGQAKLVRQQQAELEHLNSKLVQKNDALDQFVYRVSHDLKAPTVNILSLLKVVKARVGHQEDTMLQKSLGFLNDSAERLQRTTLDLLEVSRLEKGLSEESVWNDLEQNYKVAKSALTEQILATNAEFHTHFEYCQQVYLSTVNLQSILSNLLTNAIKYRHPDRYPMVEFRSETKGKWAKLIFKDNGMGIDLVQHGHKVFGMFNRFHSHVEGSGVGLYIVKKIVEKAGGEIEVSSKVGEGTTFLILLPLYPENSPIKLLAALPSANQVAQE